MYKPIIETIQRSNMKDLFKFLKDNDKILYTYLNDWLDDYSGTSEATNHYKFDREWLSGNFQDMCDGEDEEPPHTGEDLVNRLLELCPEFFDIEWELW